MHATNLLWPSDRKLFRQRSRLRALLPVVAVVVAALATLALALGHAGWA